jgi:hypothetical protein
MMARAMDKEERVTMKLSLRANMALKALRGEMGSDNMSEALLLFIEKTNPALARKIDDLTAKQLDIIKETSPNRTDVP